MKFLWVFDQDAVWTLIPAVSLLWAAGGSGIKAFRKYGVPFLVSISALSLGVAWWMAVINCLSMMVAFSVPYGSDSKKFFGLPDYWLWLYFVGGLYAFSMVPIVFLHSRYLFWAIGVVISSIAFGVTTYTSQNFDFPKWKFVEIILGALLGLQAAWLLV